MIKRKLLIQGIRGKLDDEGNIIDEKTLLNLREFIRNFEKHIEN